MPFTANRKNFLSILQKIGTFFVYEHTALETWIKFILALHFSHLSIQCLVSGYSYFCFWLQILEKLYGPNHIVIGYELVKLSSIQLSLGDCTDLDNINRLSAIFSNYYGEHASIIYPYLSFLERETCHIIH